MQEKKTAGIGDDKALMKNVRNAVRIHQYEVTVGDVISETGLGDHEAKDALDELMQTHECTLRVSEGGDLIYAFSKGLAVRKEHSWFRRHAWAIGNAAKTAVKFLFMLVFLFYTVISVVVLTAFALAWAFITAVVWLPIMVVHGLILRNFGFEHGLLYHAFKKWFDIDLDEVLSLKHFFKSIWIFFVGSSAEDILPLHRRLSDFVFGPSEKTYAINEHVACARLIRAKQGVITAEDWMFITGKPIKEAESDLSKFTAEFDGKAEITENGTLVYIFETMMRTTDNIKSDPPLPVWDVLEPPLSLTGSKKGKRSIIFVNVLMFLLSGYVSYYTIAGHYSMTLFNFMTTLFPFIFYSIVFLFPLVRLPRNIWLNRKRRARSVKDATLAALYPLSESPREALPILRTDILNTATSILSMHAYKKRLQVEEVEHAVDFLMEDLGGECIEDLADKAYVFKKLAMHLADAQKTRKRLSLDRLVTGDAQIAFSTDQAELEKIGVREERKALTDFDRKLESDSDSSVAEQSSHAEYALANTQSKTNIQIADNERKFKQFTENREWICHQLEWAVQNHEFAEADEIINQYPPELMEDETYAALARACSRGHKMTGVKLNVEHFFDFKMFKIECPKTVLALGFLDILFAVVLFSDITAERWVSPLIGGLLLVAHFVVTFVACSDLSINPWKYVDEDDRSQVCIWVFPVLLIAACVLM